MRENKNNLQIADCGEADGGLHVVVKGEERRCVRQNATMGCHPVRNRTHRMFADTKRDVPASVAPFAANTALGVGSGERYGLEITEGVQSSTGRGIQIGRASDDVRDALCKSVQNFSTRGTRRNRL